MYISTRGWPKAKTAAEAVKAGIAPDGGLFVPDAIPKIDTRFLETIVPLTYQERAAKILSLYLPEYTHEELAGCAAAAYSEAKFDSPDVAPLHCIDEQTYVLELWHGPTSAFKDMALQLLPQLLVKALEKTGETSKIAILVATSGDTGKAALAGFSDVPHTEIVVFFPQDGVSQMQRLQMVTQEGNNVSIIAVKGNFDDAQTGVKRIFNDRELNRHFAAHGIRLSSANSINWGRLAPQIVYYFSAYADMLKQGRLSAGDAVNFVVPTGNFGNILAGYYAKLMGLPIKRLVCASNRNNVLTEFIRTGVYDRNKSFFKTLSPSMDILISSNLERLLYLINGGNTAQVKAWQEELDTVGRYQIDQASLALIQHTFWADWADDVITKTMIRQVYREHNYVIDPHTAVAWQVNEKFRLATAEDNTPSVILSTASPFKFNESVLAALLGEESLEAIDEFSLLDQLSDLTGWSVPRPLAVLRTKEVLHHAVCDKANMADMVAERLCKA